MSANLKKICKTLLFLFIVTGCMYILKPGLVQYAERSRELERYKAEIAEIEAERVRLEEQRQKLEEEDPELIERLAREKLHLSKPGETVFKFKKRK
jgi:cell division protein FtsB